MLVFNFNLTLSQNYFVVTQLFAKIHFREFLQAAIETCIIRDETCSFIFLVKNRMLERSLKITSSSEKILRVISFLNEL